MGQITVRSTRGETQIFLNEELRVLKALSLGCRVLQEILSLGFCGGAVLLNRPSTKNRVNKDRAERVPPSHKSSSVNAPNLLPENVQHWHYIVRAFKVITDSIYTLPWTDRLHSPHDQRRY